MPGLLFLSWTSNKQHMECLAQGHNTMTLPAVRLEPATIGSQVKHSTKWATPLHKCTFRRVFYFFLKEQNDFMQCNNSDQPYFSDTYTSAGSLWVCYNPPLSGLIFSTTQHKLMHRKSCLIPIRDHIYWIRVYKRKTWYTWYPSPQVNQIRWYWSPFFWFELVQNKWYNLANI